MIPTNRHLMTRRAMLAGTMTAIAAPAMLALAQTPGPSPVTRGGTYMADARDRLRSLLALVPAEALGGPDPTSELFSWNDLETQFFAHGIDDPMTQTDKVVDATVPMAITDDLMQYAMDSSVREAVGFSALEVHQVLVAGVSPNRVAIYAGGIDAAGLAPAWEAAGYTRMTGDHGEFWTLGENGELDIARPGPLALGSLNNVALLADDTVVFARTAALLDTVLARQGATAADDADLATLIDTLPADAVSAVALPGATFRADTMVPENPGRDGSTTVADLLAESDAAVGPMPPLALGLVCVTSGAAPAMDGTPAPAELRPRARMAFLTGSEDDARAAAGVAFWRLANMQSPTTGVMYSERFVPTNTVEDAVAGPVMIVEFGPDVASSGNWWQIVAMRDTWPFAWLEGEARAGVSSRRGRSLALRAAHQVRRYERRPGGQIHTLSEKRWPRA